MKKYLFLFAMMFAVMAVFSQNLNQSDNVTNSNSFGNGFSYTVEYDVDLVVSSSQGQLLIPDLILRVVYDGNCTTLTLYATYSYLDGILPIEKQTYGELAYNQCLRCMSWHLNEISQEVAGESYYFQLIPHGLIKT